MERRRRPPHGCSPLVSGARSEKERLGRETCRGPVGGSSSGPRPWLGAKTVWPGGSVLATAAGWTGSTTAIAAWELRASKDLQIRPGLDALCALPPAYLCAAPSSCPVATSASHGPIRKDVSRVARPRLRPLARPRGRRLAAAHGRHGRLPPHPAPPGRHPGPQARGGVVLLRVLVRRGPRRALHARDCEAPRAAR